MKYINKVICVLVVSSVVGCARAQVGFQADADQIRLEHLEYWTALMEEYNSVKGYYPLQNKLQEKNDIGLVKIATKQQMSVLSVGGSNYNKRLDNNSNGRFKEESVATLVTVLEAGLNRTIAEKYDIQKVPVSSPVGYFYFYTEDGYLLWVTCITCDVTLISTLLFDGYTPTVNVVSEGMKGKVAKALLREEMLSHPIYREWKARGFQREEHVRSIVKENEADSKQ